jgi:palmitoyl-protein thioesterase
VVPRDSAWFSWFNGTNLVPLREQPLYTEDRLGLAEMDLNGKLFFEEVPGGHMQFTLDEFYALVDHYFK